MENKKTKLTISGNPKKSFKDFSSSKDQSKKTVVIDKKSSKPVNRGNFNKPFQSKTSPNFKRGLQIKLHQLQIILSWQTLFQPMEKNSFF